MRAITPLPNVNTQSYRFLGKSVSTPRLPWNLGKAYDIACRSSSAPKVRPPVLQEALAKKIVEAAQRGERDPDRLAAIALGALGPFHRNVTGRFGLAPNFFMSAPDAPEIVEKLWDFATSAYLDNPIPSLLRSGYLLFCRASARSATVMFVTADFWSATAIPQAMPCSCCRRLSRRSIFSEVPLPWGRQLDPIYERLAAFKTPIDWPEPGSDVEDCIFAASALIFVDPSKSERAQQTLRQALGGKRLEYLLALLTFIRAAHYWTMVHPGLEIEDDVREMMSAHKELAFLLLQDPDLGYR